jgi:hypothetical protein
MTAAALSTAVLRFYALFIVEMTPRRKTASAMPGLDPGIHQSSQESREEDGSPDQVRR